MLSGLESVGQDGQFGPRRASTWIVADALQGLME